MFGERALTVPSFPTLWKTKKQRKTLKEVKNSPVTLYACLKAGGPKLLLQLCTADQKYYGNSVARKNMFFFSHLCFSRYVKCVL